MIERKDFRVIIEKYDSQDALIYCDPPYIGREKWYAGGFTVQDHRDLADLLNHASAKVIISYYDDPLLDELYPADRWRRVRYASFTQVPGGDNRPSEELLLMNWSDPQMSLWDMGIGVC